MTVSRMRKKQVYSRVNKLLTLFHLRTSVLTRMMLYVFATRKWKIHGNQRMNLEGSCGKNVQLCILRLQLLLTHHPRSAMKGMSFRNPMLFHFQLRWFPNLFCRPFAKHALKGLAVRQVAKSKTKENTKPSGVRYLLRSIERRSQQTK